MSEKIIDEVMGLVETLKSEWTEYLSVEDDEVIVQGLKVDSAEEAIRAKLREVLVRKPLSDVDVQIEAHNEDDFDWNDLGHKKTWHKGFAAGFRAAECTHKIGAE